MGFKIVFKKIKKLEVEIRRFNNKSWIESKKTVFNRWIWSNSISFFLGFVLVKLEGLFGIPSSVLYFLASIPIFFVIYDFYCYWKHLKIGLLLKGIAVLNLVYCCISIGLISYYFNTIKILGWTYIIVEIILIIFLAMIEFRVGEK